MPVQTVIKTRRDTAANWLSTNPVLAAGETGLESDTGLVKFGNGTSAWDALQYSSAARVVEVVKNSTGGTVSKGSVVYISGANGANPLISLADADSESTSSKTLGFVVADIADGARGMVLQSGLLTGVNTGSANAGDSVWLSGTAGGFVFGAPPAKPAHSVYLGIVTRVQSQNGEILVKVQNGYEINELHDVNAGSPSDNNLLAWDSLTSMWTNQTAAQAGLATAANPTFTGTLNAAAVTITGNLTVGGTTTTVNATDLVVEDPLIYIGEGNSANLVDLGIVSSFNDGTYQHSGLVRDASDSKWKLFKGVTDEPTTTVNFAQGSLDALAVGAFEASSAIIGNVSNTELQYLDGVTSAIQTQLNAKAPLANPTFTGTVDLTGATVTGITGLPSQTGNTGKYLTTNGSAASWATISGDASTSGTLAQFASTSSSQLAGVISDETGSGALVFGTSAALNYPTLKSPKEITTVSATSATGTINYDVLTQADLYYTSNASANFTLNFRGSSGATLDSSMATGETATLVFRNTNGTTAYYPNAFTIDGTSVTPKWLGGTAPSSGNASAIDVYSFVITKTGSATYTVLASVAKFA
jgi:ribosomal protein L35AE/L33A